MAARRCGSCLVRWPDQPAYKLCPRCQAETRLQSVGTPTLTDAEASHELFDAFYARRERERTLRGDVSPEILGRLEARALIRRWSQAKAVLAGPAG